MSEKTRSMEEAKVRRLSLAAAVVALGASVGVQAADISGFPIRQPAPVEGQATVAAPVIRQEKQQALQPATRFQVAPGTGATQMKLDGLSQQKELEAGRR